MVSYTTDLNLRKPAGTDKVKRPLDFNENWEKIDRYLGQVGKLWSPFDVKWLAVTTNPDINSGTLQAFWIQIGRLIAVKYLLVMDADTTYGTGSWRLTLPVPVASFEVGQGVIEIGSFTAFDASADNVFPIVGLASSSLILDNNYLDLEAGNATGVSSTVPFTWAANDALEGGIVYQRFKDSQEEL